MDADKRKETVSIITAMNFIPLIISILTLLMILCFAFGEIHRATLEGITITILLSSLPVLGITTYVSNFVYRNSLEKQWIWDLGCVNGVIWTIIFLGIFLAQLLTNPFSSLVSFASFIYFGYLVLLNKKMIEFKSIEELELNP